jgi:hypothetical protein
MVFSHCRVNINIINGFQKNCTKPKLFALNLFSLPGEQRGRYGGYSQSPYRLTVFFPTGLDTLTRFPTLTKIDKQ